MREYEGDEGERQEGWVMKVVCMTCMHHCSLEEGQRGICRARKNEKGNIICENYGMATSLALDPIEKKAFEEIPSRGHGVIGGELWMQFEMPVLPEL